MDLWFEVSVTGPPNSLNCYHGSVILTVDLFVSFQFCIQRFINFVVKLGKFPSLLLGRVWRLPRWHSDKESTCQCRRCKTLGFDPGLGRSPGVGNGNPAPVFLPGKKSHEQRSLAGYIPWDCKELNTTEQLNTRCWESFRESNEGLSSLCPRVQQEHLLISCKQGSIPNANFQSQSYKTVK